MQTSYWYSSYSRLSISTPVVTSEFLSSQIKVIYVFSLSYPHSYQSIPLLSCTPGNNSVLLKYATTHDSRSRYSARAKAKVVLPLLLSTPFHSGVIPLHSGSLCSCSAHPRQCHKLHSAISPSILHRFSRSQWLRKALEETFLSVPVTSRGDQ